jgi:hypothetical protein
MNPDQPQYVRQSGRFKSVGRPWRRSKSKDNRTGVIGILGLREDRGENTAARRRGKTNMQIGTLR